MGHIWTIIELLGSMVNCYSGLDVGKLFLIKYASIANASIMPIVAKIIGKILNQKCKAVDCDNLNENNKH
ncbi:hypothetical protein DERP_000127 [Dermatophagoides pteronyssinus]|uniref:Uncharacterized protein n=1 Tax=Dermatophagoides pteronyssinus TaxID=6956 RepID=A0ABQ8IZB2_DERPT|nr:hypothetical protein DERP_000127 [Dermatophagoides pteronyssinus]